jgi:drug/metabolite transporter (DMT)-like permease
MLAIVGGLGAAAAFAAATLCSSRSTRLIGPSSVLAWVMLVGLLLTGPLAIRDGLPAQLVGSSFGWVVLAGCGNVLGLLLGYAGLRIGHVGLVAPILSAEGALAAVISVVAGEPIALGMAATLGLVAIGIGLAGIARGEHTELTVRDDGRAALYAVAAALAFGASLYGTGRLGAELPLAWVLLPARLVGVLVVGVPLALTRRLRLSRRVLPLVVASGLCEVAGFGLFTLGARDGIAISAVLASQFGALAGVIAFLLFRERLARVQVAGVATIAVGVGILSLLRA